MSAATDTEEAVAQTWHMRQATPEDDWQGLERQEGKLYWVRWHDDGRRTKVCASPADAVSESKRMDDSPADAEAATPAAQPDEAEGARQKILSDLETAQLARRTRFHQLTETAVSDVWLSDEESEELERLGGEYEGAYDAAVEALGGDTDAVQEVRDRIERAEPVTAGNEEPVGSDDVADADAADTPEAVEQGIPSAEETLFPAVEVAPAPLSQQIHPSRITTHPSTLMRAGGLDPEHVDSLEAKLRGGGRVPGMDVYFDGSTYWLGDGNHRHAAALRADAVLDVNLHKGSLRDAILHAVRANAEHGLKRTNDDKRLAVVTLLADEEWGRLSDTQVGELAEVSQPFVGKVQAWLVKLLPVLGGDGVEDPSDVSNEEFGERAGGVPEGVVEAVRGLTDEQLTILTNNVMGRAETRTSADGRRFSVEQRPAVEEPSLPLIADEPSRDEPPVEAQASAGGTAEASGESAGPPPFQSTMLDEKRDAREEVVVTDRRRFKDELTPSAPTPATAPAVAPAPTAQQAAARSSAAPMAARATQRPPVEELLKGRAMSISYTWIPGVKGKVNVSVNVGGKPANQATRKLVDSALLVPFPEAVTEMIARELEAPGSKGASKPAGSESIPSPKAERIVKDLKAASSEAELKKLEAHYKLDNLSRFATSDASLINGVLAAQRRKLAAPKAAKGAAKGAAMKTAAKGASKKASSKKAGAKKAGAKKR